MHKIVDDTLPPAYAATARDKFRIRHVTTSHDRMLGKVGASTPGRRAARGVLSPAHDVRGPPAGAAAADTPSPTDASGAAAAHPAAAGRAGRRPGPGRRDRSVGTARRHPGRGRSRRHADVAPRPPPHRRSTRSQRTHPAAVRRPGGSDGDRRPHHHRHRAAQPGPATGHDGGRHGAATDVHGRARRRGDRRPAPHRGSRRRRPRWTRRCRSPPERAMVPRVLPFIDSNRSWEQVRIGVITEFGGLVNGTAPPSPGPMPTTGSSWHHGSATSPATPTSTRT